MPDLFAQPPAAPLAERLRPHTLDDVVGQNHLTDTGKPLRTALESGMPHSMILWGAPGIGKTTLAQIVAQGFQAHFEPLSAVFSGVKDIREAVAQAQSRHAAGQRTVLFVDEIHRFNKSQQDAFLPYVENGVLVFIGATTENPSFEVNAALLSRTQVYTLKPLGKNDLNTLCNKALNLPEYAGLTLADDTRAWLLNSAGGDARRLLNHLERILSASTPDKTLTVAEAAALLGDTPARFDKNGDVFYQQISALHKSVRGSHPNAALYWFCRMLDGGADPRYIGRRLVRMAWEDIGLADPRALQLANTALDTYERLGSPEGELALAQTVLYLASAAKSNAGYTAFNEMREFVRHSRHAPVPPHLCNAPTAWMQEQGFGATYRYPHDEAHAYAAAADYMPAGMAEPDCYRPTSRGLEAKIAEKLAWLKQLDQAAQA
ncbi:replication-associated recombination protein A [Conchiformibius steedae]|uniref:replication-associated recombination protein A n=1 Tax=Conchiformibius steedae TaxID=153493 RepID=UPI0026ECB315|nr:replication-associated recombination protein A [Conchiformibius steedae]